MAVVVYLVMVAGKIVSGLHIDLKFVSSIGGERITDDCFDSCSERYYKREFV